LVESQKFPGSPLIYELSDEAMTVGKEGGVYQGKSYEGFHQALERLRWHIDSDLWNYTREDYRNNGIRIV
jgi:hypothetical protein